MPAARARSSSIKSNEKTKKYACSHSPTICAQPPVSSVLDEFLSAVSLDHRRVVGADNSGKPEALFGIRRITPAGWCET
jgi:hypothetical protein